MAFYKVTEILSVIVNNLEDFLTFFMLSKRYFIICAEVNNFE